MKKAKKLKPQLGKYILNLDPNQLVVLQKRRSLWLMFAHVCLVISLFISQDCMITLASINWLSTLYFGFMLIMIAVMVWAGVFNFRGGKIDRELSEKYVPKRGLNSVFTFTCFELQFVLAALWTVFQTTLISWIFDIGGLVITLMSAVCAVCAFMVRLISVKTYRNNCEYLPPVKLEVPVEVGEDVEDFYASDKDGKSLSGEVDDEKNPDGLDQSDSSDFAQKTDSSVQDGSDQKTDNPDQDDSKKEP